MADRTSNRRRFGRNIIQGVLSLSAALAGLIILAWCLGIIVTDRYIWSQWLWWIPTPAALATGVIGLLCALRPAKKPQSKRIRLVGWAAATALLTFYFCFIEHHFLRSRPASPEGLRIVNLNAWHSPDEQTPQLIETIAQHRGAVTVLTTGYGVAWKKQITKLTQGPVNRVNVGPFTILTRLEIDSLQPFAMTRDGIRLALLSVHTAYHPDRPIRIYLIDLPSSPKISRWTIASKVRQYLDEVDAPPPDVVLGDFNITRRSASMAHMFPTLHHAYDDAGRGYTATFHRAFPLYHIDHMLLSEHWRATRYDVIDPGAGRHLLQSAHIVPHESARANTR